MNFLHKYGSERQEQFHRILNVEHTTVVASVQIILHHF